MQYKGFLKRAVPFAAAFVIGILVTSLFVDIRMPQFGGKHKRKAEMRRLKVENEELRNENLRLKNLIENKLVESIDLKSGELRTDEVKIIREGSFERGIGTGSGTHTIKRVERKGSSER